MNSASSVARRQLQRRVGRGPVEAPDPGVAKQPLGVGLARRQDGRQVRQPGPTTISGSARWPTSWQAAHSADTSTGVRSCSSSMNTATPWPRSPARPARSVSSSTRSISMSPESARPRTDGTSMPGCHRRGRGGTRATRPPAGAASAWANDFRMPSRWFDSLSGAASSRIAGCSAAASGWRSERSGRISSLPVPQPRRTADERSALSSTVLPTPRRPVSMIDRSGRARPIRSSRTSKDCSSASRPASSGGRWPAPGA